MPRQPGAVSTTMLDIVGQAIATADAAEFQTDPSRYRRLAFATLGPLGKPTEAMVDAAHERGRFVRRPLSHQQPAGFRRAVKAMIAQAQRE